MKQRCHVAIGLVLAGLCELNALAQSNWQITEATYSPVTVAPQSGVVCSSYDNSVCADISHFYKFDHRMLWRFTLIGNMSDNWGIRATIITGAKAEKLTVQPRLILGLIKATYLSATKILSSEIYGTLGGDSNHQPCVDEYDREYYCGNLTAWSDFKNKKISSKEYGIKFLYRY